MAQRGRKMAISYTNWGFVTRQRGGNQFESLWRAYARGTPVTGEPPQVVDLGAFDSLRGAQSAVERSTGYFNVAWRRQDLSEGIEQHYAFLVSGS
jgi:hypothetical protein